MTAMDSRTKILSDIQKAVGEGQAMQGLSYVADPGLPDAIGTETTLQRFVEMLRQVGGEGHILNDEEAAISMLRAILGEFRGKTMLMPPSAELDRLCVPRLAQECDVEVLCSGSAAWSEAESANFGITVAQYGIADTGTVALRHDSASGRLAALLPPVHVVVLRRKDIFPDKATFLARMRGRSADLGANPMTWVTGPSLTADIEKVLVRGAHGPGRVIVLVY